MKVRIGGVEMAYEDGGVVGPPVLLIHGFPLCRKMWRPQYEALQEAGYRPVIPDLAGFGESAVAPPGGMDSYADRVVGLLDQLGIDSAAVGGMSMGGYVLLNLLDRYPHRVSAALFLVTRAAADDEPARMKRSDLARQVAAGSPEVVSDAFEGVLFAPETPVARPDLIEEVRSWMHSTPPDGLIAGLLAMRDRPDYLAKLGGFDLPSLVVGARQDRAVPPEHARALAEGLPRAELEILEEAGHMANLERPGAFNDCLLAFLRRHRPA